MEQVDKKQAKLVEIDYDENVDPRSYGRLNIRELMDKTRNFSCAILGKRRTGKTVLLKNLLYEIKDWYTSVHVFSQTAELQKNIFDYVPKENIYKGLDLDMLDKVWKEQENYVQEAMLNMPKGADPTEYKRKLNHVCLIFDDVVGDPAIRNTPRFNDLFILSRHILFSVIVLSQSVSGRSGLNKVCRDNLDLCLSFFPSSEYDRKLIVDQYISTISRKVGMEVLLNLTDEPFNAIVIANFITDHDPKKYIFTYKAKLDVPKFMIDNKKKKAKKTMIDPYLITQLKKITDFEDPIMKFKINFDDDA